MKVLQGLIEKSDLKLIKKCALKVVKPMLATIIKDQNLDDSWIFENKWDGYRALVFCSRGKVTILSRNHKDLTPYFPELLKAFEALNRSKWINGNDFIMDGEIVVMKNKLSNFSALQKRMGLEPIPRVLREMPVRFYAFDLIYFGGYALELISLLKRKAVLKALFPFKNPIFYTKHYTIREKEKLISTAKKAGWEGIMAKRSDSAYSHKRTSDWLKIKWAKKQELVIAGFTAPKGQRYGFGALLLGYYDRGHLRYAGKVGTGYTTQLLTSLHARLIRLKTKRSPFNTPIQEEDITWVKPKLVAELKFTEWTPDGKLRHPSFEGLRLDKAARQVVREDKS
jgi:DNA ligase D-like protein (predicted ligase)